jgi:hypothetical protein
MGILVMKTLLRTALAIAALIAAHILPMQAWAGETIVVEATATWESKGNLYLTGKDQAMFVGGLSGVMFVQDGKGALNAAQIVCPGMIDVNLESGEAHGEGRCIITGAAGDRVFAAWECVGIATAGCIGKFDLTAGTGRFEGVTGGGPFALRSAISELRADLITGEVDSIGLGLASWPKLTLVLP